METKKNKEKYFCESCNFTTGYKQNYLKHLSTAKHRRVIFGNKKELGDFYCECCDYRTVRKQNFIKHLATEVHLETKKDATLTCVYCEKKYKTRAGLWKHKKKCKIGKKIPSFSMILDDGSELKSKDFNGKNIVIYFYPKDMTPGCTAQSCNLSDNYKLLQKR